MPKQRRRGLPAELRKMSFVERAGLLFGVVGLLADGAAFLTFATGISSLHEYIPPSVPTSSALLFFAIVSGLFIIYGWFALAWYFVRRSFVLLGQMPIRFHKPLMRRSTQTVIGLGVIIVPLAIGWSLVNLSDELIKGAAFSSTTYVRMTVTPPPSSLTQTSTTTSDITATESPFIIKSVPISDESRIAGGWMMYFLICFPFFAVFFGFVVWLPINLLMPIVHVELLLEGIDGMDDILDYLNS